MAIRAPTGTKRKSCSRFDRGIPPVSSPPPRRLPTPTTRRLRPHVRETPCRLRIRKGIQSLTKVVRKETVSLLIWRDGLRISLLVRVGVCLCVCDDVDTELSTQKDDWQTFFFLLVYRVDLFLQTQNIPDISRNSRVVLTRSWTVLSPHEFFL